MDSLKESIASKKFWFAIAAIIIGFGFAVLAAWKLSEMKSMYDTFTGLVEFVVGAYLIGNVANKWVVGKSLAKTKKKVTPPPENPQK